MNDNSNDPQPLRAILVWLGVVVICAGFWWGLYTLLTG